MENCEFSKECTPPPKISFWRGLFNTMTVIVMVLWGVLGGGFVFAIRHRPDDITAVLIAGTLATLIFFVVLLVIVPYIIYIMKKRKKQ